MMRSVLTAMTRVMDRMDQNQAGIENLLPMQRNGNYGIIHYGDNNGYFRMKIDLPRFNGQRHIKDFLFLNWILSIAKSTYKLGCPYDEDKPVDDNEYDQNDEDNEDHGHAFVVRKLFLTPQNKFHIERRNIFRTKCIVKDRLDAWIKDVGETKSQVPNSDDRNRYTCHFFPANSFVLIAANNTDHAKDQDLLSHLIKSLASYESTSDGQNTSGILQESKEVVTIKASAGASSEVRLPSNGHETTSYLGPISKVNKVVDAQGPQIRIVDQNLNSASEVSEKGSTINTSLNEAQQTLSFLTKDGPPAKTVTSDSTVRGTKLNNFDLNNVYDDLRDCEGLGRLEQPTNLGTASPNLPSWMRKDSHQSSPPQTSVNSDSLSGQSPSSSGGDAQSRTDRIVFKLFGKDPNQFPVSLRSQILEWLSHSPTEIESYIRPGCIILTIYLRLEESKWQELQDDLSPSLSRLLDVSDDIFWRTGWIYARVQHRIAFVYEGQIVLNMALPLTSHNHSQIASVTPIAVSVSERAQFFVKGCNLSRPTARLLCALEGKYLLQGATNDLLDCDSIKEHGIQCLTFPCSVPDVTGRGFIEVEDHGLSCGFFPFIVAEQDVCSEIRMLESAVEVSELGDDNHGAAGLKKVKSQAIDFIHELGWLLHRSHRRSRLHQASSNSDVFPFPRFRWLIEFSMDRDWCAVVKKLLDVLFDGNVVGERVPSELALLDMGLLHRAVRRNCKPMVELLLRYVPEKNSDTAGSEADQPVKNGSGFMFRSDAFGSAGLTPLHIAASSHDSYNVLDALTDDPGLVGIKAWKTIRDNTGSTPEDYARVRGHKSYMDLVHKKMNKKADMEHVILDIPGVLSNYNTNQKQNERQNSTKLKGFEIAKAELRSGKMRSYCKICDRQVPYRITNRSPVFRPAMLSLLVIAAVCVCASLFFKTSPEVLFVYPFRWELLKCGTM
ncbi:hypothetical protein IFM89_000003 [Coptis chinensis]|uniref:Uncharacterized protein n=1 Tax=Coptis chinensis TaxID=261450 RepID=A0A835M6B5_9MAGN|nr:hypothetical protein IFM89_000003 [Coptis chinensis]